MNLGWRVAIATVGVVLAGFGAGEHVYRRLIEKRYHEALDGRQQLEVKYGEVLADRERLSSDLLRERKRVSELSDELLASRSQLEETVGQLTEEARNVRQLQNRVGAMQNQMDQLQGELALSLQQRATPAEPGSVQLERIVVNTDDSTGLRGRVLSVHTDWKFVVIDLGWNAVSIGDTVSIFRNEQLLGRAKVERVQEGVCAATLLPEWESAEIHTNDIVRVL